MRLEISGSHPHTITHRLYKKTTPLKFSIRSHFTTSWRERCPQSEVIMALENVAVLDNSDLITWWHAKSSRWEPQKVCEPHLTHLLTKHGAAALIKWNPLCGEKITLRSVCFIWEPRHLLSRASDGSTCRKQCSSESKWPTCNDKC